MMPGLESVLRLIDEPHKRKYVDLIISLDFRQLECFLELDLITAGKIPLSDLV